MSTQDAQISVLLVEDNAADAALVQANVAADGRFDHLAFAHATTLSEALARLSQEAFGALLLDLNLPDSRGIETVMAVRQAQPGLAVIVLTGLEDETLAMLAVEAGVQDYLVKGHFDPPTLYRTLRYAIERQRLETELRKANETLEERVRQRTAELEETVALLGQRVVEKERAVQAMEQTQRRFELLMNALPEVFWMATPDLREIIFCNTAYEKLWHRPCSSLKDDARSWMEPIHPEDRRRIQEHIQDWLFGEGWRREPEQTVSFRLVRPDGTCMPIRCRIFAISPKKGELLYVCGIASQARDQQQEAQADKTTRADAVRSVHTDP